MKRNDLFLLGFLFVILGVFFLLTVLFRIKEPEKIVVTVDGTLYGTYSLQQDQSVEIENTNLLIIEDGSAYVKEANCPDQICVHHKAISKRKEVIVCLPNKVLIEVKGSEDTMLDAIAK